MKISVVIPTYQRIPDLQRCLEALMRQQRLADEILVIVQEADKETWEFAGKTEYPGVSFLPLNDVGQVAALNRGLQEARGDIFCFTDDDAAPYPDWLQKIEAHFRGDSRIGGVGGRDRMHINGKLVEGKSDRVAVISGLGRIFGNHHLGYGAARNAEHLKGVNMSYRREAVAGLLFDTKLRGRAQYRNDFAFSRAVKNRGWKLLYDPEILVDHYLAVRSMDAQRGQFQPETVKNESFNEFYAVLKYFPPAKKIQGILWNLLVGNIAMPGVLQIFRKMPYPQKEIGGRMKSAYKGRWEACKEILRPRA